MDTRHPDGQHIDWEWVIMPTPRQAVILAGGRGARLAPLTDSIPKPMVDVHGEPFLAHLLRLVARQGIGQVILLTGYRAGQIEDYFGQGEDFGLEISYSRGPESWSTGERLIAARDLLAPVFLLLYADNYVAFDVAQLVEADGPECNLVLTVCPKAPGNVDLAPNGAVRRYLSDRSAGQADFVEVGFSLVKRDRLLSALALEGGSLPMAIQAIVETGEVSASIVRHPYFSVSDPDRLQKTRLALGERLVILLDRDGVINTRPATGEYVARYGDFQPIEANWRAMSALAELGFSFVIISNQAGVARGIVDPVELDDLHQRMLEDMRARGITVLGVYVCPHHWDDGCTCRKPLPGMFYLAAADHSLLLDQLIYVGDDVRDEAAALAAGCAPVLIGSEADSAEHVSTRKFVDLAQAVPFIVSHYQSRRTGTMS